MSIYWYSAYSLIYKICIPHIFSVYVKMTMSKRTEALTS